jgi:alkanesulfonate monooxygenase SsuD/methylene tetrahydromethanopterin reductase-like flavin-dependent oxidoreductase (luciferase family)
VKLGVVLGIRNHPDAPRPRQTVYQEYLDDAIHAEQLGFDHVWVNEHYLGPDDFCPSAFPVVATIAARTKQIRIGTAVCCPPFHDPLRVALDAAVLDVLSDGRLDLGLGMGSSYEYRFFGASPEEAWRRSWEAAHFIESCFRGEPFSFEGRYYSYDELAHTTRPVQDPLPIWWGGFGPQSMRRAARRGYHVFSAGSEAYDQALRAAGRRPEDHEVAQVTFLHVADSRDRAWDEAQHGLHWIMAFHRERRDVDAGATPDGPLPELPPADELRDVDGLCFVPGLPFLIGTPDEVGEALVSGCRANTSRVTQLALTFRHPGMRTPEVRRSMELFQTQILPELTRAVG